MSNSFSNQTLAQLELWENQNSHKYENKVYRLPKYLDEKVARLHLGHYGAKLTVLEDTQADYIGVKVEGPLRRTITSIDSTQTHYNSHQYKHRTYGRDKEHVFDHLAWVLIRNRRL